MYQTIIGLIVFVLILIFIFKLVKNIAKTILFGIFLILIVTGIFGIFIYKDVIDLKENFKDSSKLILLQDEQKFLTGLKLYEIEFEEENGFKEYILTEKQLGDLQQKFDGDYGKILGENYKIFVFKIEIFNELLELEFDNKVLSKDFIFRLLRADDAIEMYEREQGEKPEDITEDSELKGTIFFRALNKLIEEKGPIFILREYKRENILAYPETAVFKLPKLAPISLIRGSLEKLQGKITNK